ncbi:hypothetical protein FOS14_12845 [Skermania sp. ID1734]|uniref:lipase family protein n=1 Tax=Skermania sp. ID1734 TaxID=2597516 RepID=UPI00117CD9B3|nr:lipase family protein [Skermania sp. ID1734]TSD99240.1 hypothetical protein FOS14_12845 [Skermania sp. ID1734]
MKALSLSGLRFRWVVVMVASVGLLVAFAGFVPGRAFADPVVEPQVDPFYVPPPDLANLSPGAVIRTRQVGLTFYSIPTPLSATQIYFRTTDSHGAPVATATTVVLPLGGWTGPARRVVAYQIAINGLAGRCDPSYRLRVGTEGDLRVIAQLVQQGYAVVVTDHQGPRHAYGAGLMSAHAVLDGIRAAEATPELGLVGARTPVALWGYSGGALATGWAVQEQPRYAPELNVVGAAFGGTPADPRAAGKAMDGGIASSVFLMAVIGTSREYPELDTYRSLLNDQGRQAEQVLGGRCIEDGAIAYPFRRFSDFTTVPDPLDDPRLASVFDQLTLGKSAPTAPVYLYHAAHDEGMPLAAVAKLDADWCRQGSRVWFVVDPLAEHISLAVTAIPGVLSFLADRFTDRDAPSNCFM